MYQALYRKWRPRVFDDVVGQEHITGTLRRQVETGRLSHAYLFTGTRGTGKTTCAKLLARAVNCEHPVDGSPCNQCPSCLGIENGSVLDVVELDAASNNRVDDIRAILDEAVYTPASVRKRVYIVDEVHMLSSQAFNALLQILEEPPEHLMFILATTEIHKVPATIKSRCQQFAFKRIHADSIAARLRYVAKEEGLPLTDEGSGLIARLADGGMRDALSLLDQCIGDNSTIGEAEILEALGLAGNLDTANLMSAVAAGDVESALSQLDRLYAGGKEMAALLSELASLARDLLIRKTAPASGASLMTGGFDGAVLKELSASLTSTQLVHMLTVLQRVGADIVRSINRRTDVELCLISLCDPALDDSSAALKARLDELERRMEQGGVPVASAQPVVRPVSKQAPQQAEVANIDDLPPWVQDEKPVAKPAPQPPVSKPAPQPVAAVPAGQSAGDWNALKERLEKTLNVADYCFIGNASMVTGVIEEDTVTLWADSDMVRGIIDKPDILATVADAARGMLGRAFRVAIKVGKPPVQTTASVPVTVHAAEPEVDVLEAFLNENQDLGNIFVTD